MRSLLGILTAALLVSVSACEPEVTGPETPVEPAFSIAASPFGRVSAGYDHSCALTEDGALLCWGNNDHGQVTPPEGTFVQVSAGYHESCASKADGTALCWGRDDWGYEQVLQTSVGTHDCALQNKGYVYCSYGSSPTGLFSQISVGYEHACGLRADYWTTGTVDCWGDYHGQIPGESFTQVSAGDQHDCALREDGTIACWGLDDHGQATPPTGSPFLRFVQVSAGGSHTCAIEGTGVVDCWGNPGDGQTTPPGGLFREVSAGFNHTCGVTVDGTLVCWGNDDDGKATPPPSVSPLEMRLSAGLYHNCAVKPDGSMKCWGSNTSGQVTPPGGWETPRIGDFRGVAAGGFHTCAIMKNSVAHCWGENDYGQATAPYMSFIQISAGVYHTCGLASHGTVACWGQNTLGQTDAPSGTFTQLSAGIGHNCAVRADGTVNCWGWDYYGQATPPDRYDARFLQVSAGRDHTCAVRWDKDIWCWGDNDYDQLAAPEGIYTQVSSGNDYSCGVRNDRTLVCWGRDYHGLLTPPPGNFTQVHAGAHHACAVRTDGVILCWGSQTHGEGNAPPVADPGGPYSGEEGAGIHFDGTASFDPDGQSPSGYYWDFGDGDFILGTDYTTYTYADDGEYVVAIKIVDDAGNIDVGHTTATLWNVAPVVGPITAPTEPVPVGTPLFPYADFSDAGTGDTHTAIWDWGDGRTSPGEIEEIDGSGSVAGLHAYGTIGVYEIVLTVTDDDGDSGQAVHQFVTVDDFDGIADDVDTQPSAYSNDFSDVSLGGITLGTIVDRGDQIIEVRDHENPDLGVWITSSPSGPREAHILACPDEHSGHYETDLTFPNPHEFDITCDPNSTRVAVHTAPVEPLKVVFHAHDGRTATAWLGAGYGMWFHPSGPSLDPDPDNPGRVTIAIEGVEYALEPGVTFFSVAIDVMPGDDVGCINNDGKGVIPVAILGEADFDVTQVEVGTVTLEGLEVAARGKADRLLANIEDVNGDGFDDLVLQIEDTDETFAVGSGSAALTGELVDGTAFGGSDLICIVPSGS